MVTLTRKEAGGSWHIETAAVAKGIELLRANGVNIAEVIYDDNSVVDNLLAEEGTESQKDLWHKSKNLMGKFRSTLQDVRKSVKDCQQSTGIPQPEPSAQRSRPYAYPGLASNDVAYKLKSWLYTCSRAAAIRALLCKHFLFSLGK
ncbi:hypothetical protein R1sor_006725 [Riccia sorocarpa]|uniref:RNase H type-1 domain-containing protein n=1 Tax=Riccia sorocarpa TaxID=122646 RepID=A0ABD3HRW3_9MARC